jgi:hypothetical protein
MLRFTSLLVGGALVILFCAGPQATPADDKKDAAAKSSQAWTLTEALAQLRLHSRDPYMQYVALQLAKRENKAAETAAEIEKLHAPEDWMGLQERRQSVDLFNIFSGALAVQESLQLDAMRGENTGRPAPRTTPAVARPGVAQNADTAKSDADAAAALARRKGETLRVADLKGPEVKSHPWETMLAGRKLETDPLARMVPADFALVQFRSVNKLLDVAENADLWATHLFNQASREARTQNIGERLRQQMALETQPALRPFYDLVVDDVAVVGSDLFVREGSDVTLLFRLKQPALFRTRMDSFLANAQKAHADAKRTEGAYLGVKYVELATPDRSVSVYSAYPSENLHVRSNSKAAFQRILETVQGKTADGKPVTRLGDTSEFAYIRTLYPRGAAEEDGLIYLSDPFIRRLVGPQVKITERRRMLCYNHLRMIGHAAMLYRTEHGKPPESIQALFESKCCPEPFRTETAQADEQAVTKLISALDSNQFAARQKALAELEKLGLRAETMLRKQRAAKPSLEVAKRIDELLAKIDKQLTCPDGGLYRLSADGAHGVCSHHGHAHFLTPNLEIPTDAVRGDEADEYKAFLEDYNQYWRTVFDPIAIRVQATPTRYRLETIVLPLIDNSIYTGLSMVVGGDPADLDALPAPKRNIFSVALKFNKAELLKAAGELNKGLYEFAHWFDPTLPNVDKLDVVNFISRGLGDQVALHVYDSTPVVDVNLPEMLGILTGSLNRRNMGMMEMVGLSYGFFFTSLTSPAYLSIPVQDAQVVDGFGDQLEAVFAALARQSGHGRFSIASNDYYVVPFKSDPKQVMRGFAVRVGPIKLRYFYARIGNTLYIASKDFILEDLLALEKERTAGPGKSQTAVRDATGHAMLKLRPKNWNQVLPDYRLAWAENNREACLYNQGPLTSVARAFTASVGKIDEKEMATIAGRIQQEAERLHDTRFFCPEGGHYVLSPDGKALTCSVHGSALLPKQPSAPAAESALGKHIEHFGGLTATLTLSKEGLRAVLIVEKK